MAQEKVPDIMYQLNKAKTLHGMQPYGSPMRANQGAHYFASNAAPEGSLARYMQREAEIKMENGTWTPAEGLQHLERIKSDYLDQMEKELKSRVTAKGIKDMAGVNKYKEEHRNTADALESGKFDFDSIGAYREALGRDNDLVRRFDSFEGFNKVPMEKFVSDELDRASDPLYQELLPLIMDGTMAAMLRKQGVY